MMFDIAAGTPILLRTPLLAHSIGPHVQSSGTSGLDHLIRTSGEFVFAVTAASISFRQQFDALTGGGTPSERAVATVTAYATRASTRATPYGAFAAVAVLDEPDAGPARPIRRARGFRIAPRADIGWVRSLLNRYASLVDHPLQRCFLNQLVWDNGDRVGIIDRARNEHLVLGGEVPNEEFLPGSILKTPAVEVVRELLAAGAMTAADVAAELAERFSVDRPRALRLLDALRESGYILSETRLHPFEDPLAQAMQILERVDPNVSRSLTSVESALQALRSCAVADRADRLASVEEAMRAVQPDEVPLLAIDSTVDAAGTVPARVLEDVTALAAILVRLKPPSDCRALRERLYERYESEEQMIPVIDLLAQKLGVRTLEDGAQPPLAVRKWQFRRNIHLSTLLTNALRRGARELVLDAADVEALLWPDGEGQPVVAGFDLAFELYADDFGAVEAGEYKLVSDVFVSDSAGKSLARFAHALPDGQRQRLDAYLRARAVGDGAVMAEVSVFPTHVRAANVVIRELATAHTIDIGTCGGPGIPLSVADLYLGNERGRLFFWSKSLAREVEPVKNEMINVQASDAFTRLLLAVRNDGRLVPSEFEWGTLATGPFLPRVVYGRLVLSRARWNFSHDKPEQTLERILTARSAGELDDRVRFKPATGDYIMLDLSAPAGIDLLRTELRRLKGDVATFDEELVSPWLEDEHGTRYHAELVVPVQARIPAERAVQRGKKSVFGETRRTTPPGRAWLYVRAYADAHELDNVLAGPLPALVDEEPWKRAFDRFFFVRFGDARPHLRIRFRLVDEAQSKILVDQFSRLVERGVLRDFSIHSYARELERYGGPDAMDDVELLFEASSFAALRSVAAFRTDDTVRERLALSTFEALSGALLEPATLPAWLERNREFNVKLLPAEWAIVKSLTADALDSEDVRQAAHRLRVRLRDSTPDVIDLVSTLFHMHCNRFGARNEPRLRAIQYRYVNQTLRRGAAREPAASAP